MKSITSVRATTIVLAMVMVSGVAFGAGTTVTELTTANAQRMETAFGDLAADALVAAAGTTMSMIPAVSFKSGTIPFGPVTHENVRELLTQPGETWSVVSLTGEQLRETLERSVSRAPQPNAGFLQVSGINLTYDPGEPRGMRITTLSVSGVAVQPDARYEIAMPLSLAKGGSGYFVIFTENDIIRSGTDTMVDMIVNYVDNRGTVSHTGQGRINAANGG